MTTIFFLKSLQENISFTASTIAFSSPGIITFPASPTLSFKDPPLDTTAGTPQAIASAAAKPKPSYKEGITTT